MQFEAKEKYRGMFETQKSKNKTSSGEIGLDIGTYASPNLGQDQVSDGVRGPCRHVFRFGKMPSHVHCNTVTNLDNV